MQKTCRGCKESKPITEFPVRKEAPDGRRARCYPCHRQSRRGEEARLKGRTFTPEEKKPEVYLAAILRMKNAGLVTDRTAREMANRVGGTR
jgi:hypothetical protein